MHNTTTQGAARNPRLGSEDGAQRAGGMGEAGGGEGSLALEHPPAGAQTGVPGRASSSEETP